MRFLKFGSNNELCFVDIPIEDKPKYATLSHTWGADEEEVSFNDLKAGLGKAKAGYAKIQFCGEQARKDGLSYFWVDTCCIDQTNQAELTEAINSMFRWYHKSAKCYVYLADVTTCKRDREESEIQWKSFFQKSRWFTRGWTLQELLAPRHVEFFSRECKFLGDKCTLQHEIYQATHIPIAAILGATLSAFSHTERMQWAENRKTKKPEDKAYCLLGIFGVNLPLIYGEGEGNALVRLMEEVGKSFAREGSKIGQTPRTSNSQNFHTEGTGISRITPHRVSLHDYRKELLTSMRFDQMDSRRMTIKQAYSTTCAWLLKHAAYVDWVDPVKFHQHRGFLWINGKAGAGKSTLLKFAYASAKRDRLEHEIITSFFFNARGEELEKSTTGMYRALLFQLLDEAPDLQAIFDRFYRSSEHRLSQPTWTTEILCELLKSAVAKLKQRRLSCFIDALDECDEQQVQDMIVFFEELGEHALENGSQLYICFASRHYPTIDIRSGRQLTLEDEDGHGRDLAKYIRSHLRAGTGTHIEQLRAQIQAKANGIFMWAVLVIPILNKEFCDGRIFAVQRRLNEIPAKLSNLFKHTLKRDQRNMDDFVLCLQWILFARRPLKREEFYFAMVAGLDPDPANFDEWDSETITVDTVTRFVHSSSKGLAELTKSAKPTVQFIHESVHDFLVKENGLCELQPKLKGHLYGMSHDELKRCCQTYLLVNPPLHVPPHETLPPANSDMGKDLRKRLISKFPFLQYASQNVLHHANEAAREISQNDFISKFALGTWIVISNGLQRYEIRRHTPNASLLYILAEHNFVRLILAMRRRMATRIVQGERYCHPFLAALANGHRDAALALLQHDESPPPENVLSGVEFGKAFSMRQGQTPLVWALENGHQALVNALAAVSEGCLDATKHTGRHELSAAAKMGNIEIVRRILARTSQSLSADGRQDRTTLLQAVEMNTQADLHSDALYAASHHGHEQVVQILLEAGADVNARADGPGSLPKTALQAASGCGHEKIVEILLTAGANINAQGGGDRKTALHIASEKGHEKIVEILLTAGADVNAHAPGGFYHTALYIASEKGHEKIVEMLLGAGANKNAPGELKGTALSVASTWGCEKIVEMLLTAGADVNAPGGSDGSALQAASGCGHEKIVEMLLKAGANVNARADGRSVGTALEIASSRGHEKIVQLLVAAGARMPHE